MQKAGHGNTEAGRRAWTRRAGGAVRHGGGGRLAIGQAFAARGGLAGTRTMRAPMARRDCWSLHGGGAGRGVGLFTRCLFCYDYTLFDSI
ncbi:hypothetical protein L518_3080 [Bordetella bronchiseptica MBORD675]|nr:hypothetical protein L518_3080 [Bordetella bronchiseptica MBORD675]